MITVLLKVTARRGLFLCVCKMTTMEIICAHWLLGWFGAIQKCVRYGFVITEILVCLLVERFIPSYRSPKALRSRRWAQTSYLLRKAYGPRGPCRSPRWRMEGIHFAYRWWKRQAGIPNETGSSLTWLVSRPITIRCMFFFYFRYE